ncbi:MAG: hypothetical protein FJ220_00580, partial [Kiritimatiellaceae bacterium]|nr:hypothetical protein [Kiritimatiellaceae bacterium]
MKLIHYLPVIATLLITGCATTQEPKLYILNSPSVSAETGTASDPLSLFIAPIQLPGYLDRLSIVTQSGDNEIVYSEFPRWAEPLDTSLRQKLADNLSKMVQSDRIFSDGRHPPKGTDFRN